MYDLETRTLMVEQRVKIIRRKYENCLISILALISLGLTGAIFCFANILVDNEFANVPDFYGTTMLLNDVGGYVLVAVMAFISAVVITVFCIRYREKKKN